MCMSTQQRISHVDGEEGEGDGDNYVFVIPSGRTNLPSFMIKIQDHLIRMLADSVATVNILSEIDYNSLPTKPILRQHNSNVYAYGTQTAMHIISCFDAVIESSTALCTANL